MTVIINIPQADSMANSRAGKPSSRPAPTSFDKDEEELQLEQQLFGQRKKRKIAKKSNGANGAADEEETGLKNVTDRDVSVMCR